MTSLANLLDRICAAPDEEAAALLLVAADRQRQALPDADAFRCPIDLPRARLVVRKLRAGIPVRWS